MVNNIVVNLCEDNYKFKVEKQDESSIINLVHIQ
jgi:hypothetical protein